MLGSLPPKCIGSALPSFLPESSPQKHTDPRKKAGRSMIPQSQKPGDSKKLVF
jgi:hypothetical protein